MPKFYTCNCCEEVKPLSDFPIDKRNACGRKLYQCKACKNEAASEIVNCKRCGSHVRMDTLQRHMQSTKCLEHDKPWKKFRSDGTKKVYCPCGKCKANHYKVSEKTAYQHLKFGAIARIKGRTEQEQKAAKREAASEIVSCDNCGRHVRKGCISRHKQTLKCIEHGEDQPWKKFNSGGKKKVFCPCKKCKSNHYKVTEKTAYQHLKYGAITRAKGKTEAERKAAKKEAASKIISCDNCGRHVRNDCIHKHKKTLKCIEYGEDQPWKKFNSGGTKKVYCPCDRCKLVDYKISEKSAYRHLKHGHVERPESDRDRERAADREHSKQELIRQATREWMKRRDEERDL